MNNSRKILNKLFKTSLVTVSSLTLLIGSGAFAADMRSAKEGGTKNITGLRLDYREINLETGKGLDPLCSDKHTKFADGSTLQLSNIEARINTGGNQNNIATLDLHGQNATLNVEGNIKLGSVVNTAEGDKKLQVTINDEQALTLTDTGTTEVLKFKGNKGINLNSYDALGNVTLKGNTAELAINSADREEITFEVSINGENNKNGNLTINTPVVFTKSIGNQHSLNEININATTVTFNGTEIKADKVNLTTAKSVFNIGNKGVAVLTDDVDNISGQDGQGQLIITGENSRITGNIGATNSLEAISVGEGITTLQGQVIKAKSVIFVADKSILSFNGQRTELTGNIRFDGYDAKLYVADDILIKGNLTNYNEEVVGEINFQGSGVVQGNIGQRNIDQGEALKDINIQGGDTKIVELQGDVATKNLSFVPANEHDAAGIVQIGGGLIAENVIFSNGNAQGGILEFNGQNEKGYIFSGKIENGDNATLKVNTYELTANDATIGDIKTIDIQEAKTFIVNAGCEGVTLLKGGNKINFVGADSRLIFKSVEDATISLATDLPASPVGGGKLAFIGGKDNILTINSDKLAESRKAGEVNGNKLAELAVIGNVIVTDLDISGTRQLNIIGGAKFLDQGATSAKIPLINIGAVHTNTEASETIYALDAQSGDFDILTEGNTINFMHEDAALMLQNSSVDDRTITLANTLDTGGDNFGQVVINSVEADKTLTIARADNITLGTKDHKLKELIFTGAGSIDIYPDIFATNINVGNVECIGCSDINGTLSFKGNTEIRQYGNINGNVNFQNCDAIITLANGRNITGDVLGGNSSIEFLGDGEVNGNIYGLKMLKVGKGNVLLQANDAYVINEIRGTGTKTLTLPENFNLTGAINSTGGESLKLNFTNGGRISGVVGTAANPVGDITTNGVTSFDSAVNSNGNVILSKGSITEFVDNITAINVIADDAVIMATNDLAFNSDLTGSGALISLGTSQITYTGQANFSDQLTILANYDAETQDYGNILITAGSKIDLSQVTDLQINFTAPAIDITQIDGNTKYPLISSEDGSGLVVLPTDIINITLNDQQNRFVKWSIDESSLTVSAADISKEVLKKEAKETHDPIVKEAIEALLSDNNNDKDVVEKHQYSPAVGGVVNQLGRVDKDKTPEIIKPLIQNKINPSTVVRIHTKINNIVNATLNTRMNNFAAEAAGDETETKLGVWVGPFIGNSEQKIKGDLNDYKAKLRGATVGFDGFVTDDLLLGTSYTRAYTIMKHKNDKLGDESRVKSDIYSLYGLYDAPNSNLFFSGIALYSNSLVKNYSQRPVILAGGVMSYQTAIGKYRSHSYTGQILAGYDYLSSQAVNLKPMIGIRYSKSKDASYLETGTSFQNLTVKGATSDLVEGIVGFRASKNINTGHMILTPELYSFVHRHFKDKSQLVDARLPGMTNPFPNSKINQAKISFNVGGGLTAKYKMMEYGINYNVNIANKYLAQQGSLKIRVNF